MGKYTDVGSSGFIGLKVKPVNELDAVLTINKRYKIIYDDKGRKPVIKTGVLTSKELPLIELDGTEILNINNIIRAGLIK